MTPRRIVVVGAGLSSLAMARALDLRLDRCTRGTVEVTLLTPGPSAVLSPLVPSVIGGALSPWQAAVPFRPWLRHVKLVHSELQQVDTSAKRINLAGPSIGAGSSVDYDDLVLAMEPQRAEIAPLDSSDHVVCPLDCSDAMKLRDRILALIALASMDESSRHRRAKLAVAVVGNDAYAASIALQISRLMRGSCRFLDRVVPEETGVSFISPSRDIATGLGLAASAFLRNVLEEEGVFLDHGSDPKSFGLTIQAQRTAPSCPGVTRVSDGLLSGFEVNSMGELVGTESIFALGPCAIDEAFVMKSSNTPASVLVQARRLAGQLVPLGRPIVKRRAVREALFADALHLSMDRGALVFGNRAIGGFFGAIAGQKAILSIIPSSWWHLSSPLLALGSKPGRSNGPFPSLLS